MSATGDMAKYARRAAQSGWRVERCKRSHHWRFLSPDGVTQLYTGGTPSDWRAWRNFLAAMKRAGLDLTK